MTASKIAAMWADVLGNDFTLDHDGQEVSWEFPTFSVYITAAQYGQQKLTVYGSAGPILSLTAQPASLEQIVKAICK